MAYNLRQDPEYQYAWVEKVCDDCGMPTENESGLCDLCWRIVAGDIDEYLDQMEARYQPQELPEDYKLDPLYKLLD